MTKKKKVGSYLEEYFDTRWRELYPSIKWEREIMLVPGRRFKFDFANQDDKVAVEIQGGTYSTNRTAHSTCYGLKRDYTKYNLAIAQGYRLFQLDKEMVHQDEWYTIIAGMFRGIDELSQ